MLFSNESDVHDNDIVDDYASIYEMRDDFISQMQQAGCPRGHVTCTGILVFVVNSCRRF